VGATITPNSLRKSLMRLSFAAARQRPRDLPLPGRSLQGIHFAMEFSRSCCIRLSRQTCIADRDDVAGCDSVRLRNTANAPLDIESRRSSGIIRAAWKALIKLVCGCYFAMISLLFSDHLHITLLV